MKYNVEDIKKLNSNVNIEFVCEECKQIFTKTKRELSKLKYKLPKFCTVECRKKWNQKNCYTTVKCQTCNKEFEITKGVYNHNKSKHFFCSRSCSAIATNKLRVEKSNIKWVTKNKGYNQCPICNKEKFYTSKYCKICCNMIKSNAINERTLGSYINGHKYLSHYCSDIRKNARYVIENSDKEKVCAYCHNHEFDEILEVHHIKGILEFDRETKIKNINHIDNLVWLCPNHHTMIEKGLITLKIQ